MKPLYLLLLLFLPLWGHGQATTPNLVVFPNPFCSIAYIQFTLPFGDSVSINAFDILGNKKQTLFNHTYLPAGSYTINLYGDSLPDGMYAIKFDFDTFHLIKKVVKQTCALTPTYDSITLSIQPFAFSCVATIQVQLFQPDTISLVIYNRWGQIIDKLFDHVLLPAGTYSIKYHGDSIHLTDTYFLVLNDDSTQLNRSFQKFPCTQTSIHEIKGENLVVYPNPTSDYITIDYGTVDWSSREELQLHITDIVGKEIYNTSVSRFSAWKKISTTDLASGMYLISLSDMSGRVLATQKMGKE